MTLRLLALAFLVTGCAQAPIDGTLLENHAETSREVRGLLRSKDGPFIRGQVEVLRAVVDTRVVKSLSWSASAGALSTRGGDATWTLPDAETAELLLTVTTSDGRTLTTPFSFSLVERTQERAGKSAVEALLATPMPVLDGGVSEVSGGDCDLQYDTAENVHLAFTTATHPAVYYGKWNGSVWALEVVDTLGFNTGGRILPSQVRLAVDASANPHILYIRDNQLRYATKSGSAWTRERVDTSTQALTLPDNYPPALALNAQGRPSVVYTSYVSSRTLLYATRTGAAAWTIISPTFASAGTLYGSNTSGDLLIDAAGVAYFPASIYGSSTGGGYASYLVALNGAAGDLRVMTNGTTAPGWDAWASGAWAGANRLVFRTAAGAYDVTVATPMANATFTFSANEQSGAGAGAGDIAWNGKPVVLHHHSGGTMELVTPQAAGASFWTWTQMGASSGISASVAVHPTTGVANICYQANSRIMFQ
jgi:hypothetical protein